MLIGTWRTPGRWRTHLKLQRIYNKIAIRFYEINQSISRNCLSIGKQINYFAFFFVEHIWSAIHGADRMWKINYLIVVSMIPALCFHHNRLFSFTCYMWRWRGGRAEPGAAAASASFSREMRRQWCDRRCALRAASASRPQRGWKSLQSASVRASAAKQGRVIAKSRPREADRGAIALCSDQVEG